MPKLNVNESCRANVTMVCTRREYTNKEDGSKYEFNTYSVLINGLPVPVQIPKNESLARRIVEEYFESLK